MKVYVKPIEVLAHFDGNGIHPIRFNIEGKKGKTSVKIDRVINKEYEKLAGNRMWVFTCESEFNGSMRPYEIKYELDTMKWILFKI